MPLFKIAVKSLTGSAFLFAFAACSGPPVSIDNPPLDPDGKSRLLFVQVVSKDVFVGELYARKAGTGSWGYDMVMVNNIYPGDRKVYNLYDGTDNCMFDIMRVVFSADEPPGYQDQMNVNICEMNRKKQAWLL